MEIQTKIDIFSFFSFSTTFFFFKSVCLVFIAWVYVKNIGKITFNAFYDYNRLKKPNFGS